MLTWQKGRGLRPINPTEGEGFGVCRPDREGIVRLRVVAVARALWETAYRSAGPAASSCSRMSIASCMSRP